MPRIDRTFHVELPQVGTLRERMARSRGQPIEDGERVSRAYLPPDGQDRPAAEEHQLNEAFSITFRDSSAAELVLDYLRSISIHAVHGPNGLDHAELAHKEGMRYLVGIIETRIQHGINHLPELP